MWTFSSKRMNDLKSIERKARVKSFPNWAKKAAIQAMRKFFRRVGRPESNKKGGDTVVDDFIADQSIIYSMVASLPVERRDTCMPQLCSVFLPSGRHAMPRRIEEE
jgi:hypothetical protein